MSGHHRVPHDQAQSLAERVAERMFDSDRASRALGMTIECVSPGRATLTMTVRSDMVNGHAISRIGFQCVTRESPERFCAAGLN